GDPDVGGAGDEWMGPPHHGGLVGRTSSYSLRSSASPTLAGTMSRSSSISCFANDLRTLVTNCPAFRWPLRTLSLSRSSFGASRPLWSSAGMWSLAAMIQSSALPGSSLGPKMPLAYHPLAFWSMGTHWYWYVRSPGRSTLYGACTYSRASVWSFTLMRVMRRGYTSLPLANWNRVGVTSPS